MGGERVMICILLYYGEYKDCERRVEKSSSKSRKTTCRIEIKIRICWNKERELLDREKKGCVEDE